MARFAPDQFDQVPKDLARVGAHRAPRKRGRGWIAVAWAALATGVLVVAGLFGLSLVNPDIDFDLPIAGGSSETDDPTTPEDETEAVEPAAPTATDPIDPATPLALSVLNGAAADDLQETAGDALLAAGWSDPGRATATVRDETDTVVYYWSAEYEAIALGVAQTLGVGTAQQSDAFPGAPVTVVLGEDYAATVGG